jgi:hypothetical protein
MLINQEVLLALQGRVGRHTSFWEEYGKVVSVVNSLQRL